MSKSSLTRTRGSLKARLTTAKKYVDSLPTDVTTIKESEPSLQARLRQLDSTFNEFLAVQAEIDESFEEIPDSELNERAEFENTYYELIDRLNLVIKRLSSPPVRAESIASSGATAQVKLPKIALPSFSGALQDWLVFRDTYESLIHNNVSISNVEKFHYLKSSLHGDAALVIQSLEFSNDAYADAWQMLYNRYNNPKMLIHNHIDGIFSVPRMNNECGISIRKMLDTLAKHLAALRILKEPTEHWSTLLIFILTKRLDPETLRAWEDHSIRLNSPIKLENLTKFLEERAHVLGSIANKQSERAIGQSKPRNFSRALQATTALASCVVCQGNHQIIQCQQFLRLSAAGKYDKARELRLCINCLRLGHSASNCRSSHCKRCKRAHHTLLHFNSPPSVLNATEELQNPQSVQGNEVTSVACSAAASQVLLATAVLEIKDSLGRPHRVRALLDSGSQSSFVTEELVERLSLNTKPANIGIIGIQQRHSRAQSKCKLNLRSPQTNFRFSSNLLVLPRVTSDLPPVSLDTRNMRIPPNIKLADPNFYVSRKIDLLIGADHFWKLLSVGQVSLGRNRPVLQKTRLGWIASGSISSSAPATICNLAISHRLRKTPKSICKSEKVSVVRAPQFVLAVDSENLCRSGDRLQHGNVLIDKMPLMLRSKHPVRRLHAGSLGLLYGSGKRYWPIAGRCACRDVVFKCIVCFRAKSKPFHPPIVRVLPEARVKPCLPSAHYGVDGKSSIWAERTKGNLNGHFMQPRAPLLGEPREVGVKFVKYYLMRVFGDTMVTYNMFSALLSQIEAILNSRPLTPLSTDPNDLQPLTPSHFLIGRSVTAVMEPGKVEAATAGCTYINKYRAMQALLAHFWKRWKTDYLNNLQQRSKWKIQSSGQPRIGQIVILMEDNAPVCQWPLGRIQELHPGRDGRSRVATIRTAQGQYKRSVNKLCPLPMEEAYKP